MTDTEEIVIASARREDLPELLASIASSIPMIPYWE